MPAIPLPMTTRRWRWGDIMFMADVPLASDAGGGGDGGAPGGAPAALHAGEADQGEGGERREDQEAGLIGAGVLLGEAERGGEPEAAEAAGHADQAGHDADLAAEALRDELEDRAVAHAQRQHGGHEDRQRQPGIRQGERDDAERDGGGGVHDRERAGAAGAG